MGVAFADQLYKADEKHLLEYLNFRDQTVFVSESTAKILIERGYLIEPTPNETKINNVDYDLEKRWSHTSELDSTTTPGTFGTTPLYEIDLPQYVRVGENFTINIPYTFVKYDINESDSRDDWEVDQIIEKIPGSELGNGEFGFTITTHHSDDMVWLNPEDFELDEGYSYKWQKKLTGGSKFFSYDLEPAHNVELRYLLNNTMDYPFHSFTIEVFPIVEEYFVNYVGDEVYEISTTEVLSNWGPSGEPEPPCPECSSPPIHQSNVPGTMPPKDKATEMFELAEDIRSSEDEWWLVDDMFADLEEYLRLGYGDTWTDEFFVKYDDLVGRMILPMLDWSIPEAHAQSSFIIVKGDVKIEELPRRYVNPSVTIEACAFDKNLKTGEFNQLAEPNLQFGKTVYACDEIENGRFLMTVTGVDPDRDGTTPDISVQVLLKNEDVELIKSKKDPETTFFQTDTKNNTW